ncbi:TRAP transporter large permease subunit [Bacillus sp. B15-48]|uniref:TRAP transporter large permease n=1 Tax=Bacillus sp. B15-48 TaxID=1548601 RepID=UPI00193F312D|nr:TRAP transporter large permease subunit [Bacillus sp. B15-48]MBM4764837.1 TRAP transporter large permease subunit [Bacillus sp. B15-48]
MEILMFSAFIIVLLVLLATGLPVAISLGIVGAIFGVTMISPGMLDQLSLIAFSQSSSFVFIIAPLFILMSEVISNSRIGTQLFQSTQLLLGRLPGSLGMGAVLTSTGFAAVCGSSPITAATIGKIAIPEMKKLGYSQKLALGATAAGGTLGILIPPSIALVLYGIITETSIGDLFIAGIIPGILIAFLLCLTIFVLVLKNPSLAPKINKKVGLRVKLRSLVPVFPILILALIVMGSIYFGIATPTESAAFGAVGAIIIVWVMKQLSFKSMSTILSNTINTTGMFFLLVIGGVFASFILTRLGIPQGLANLVLGLDIPGWAVILIINIFLIILGMFLDPMSVLVVVIPMFFPTVVELGYDPVWFGIMVTINAEIGAITPPVGLNLFVLKSVIPDVKMSEVISGSLIFIVPLVVSLVMVVLFPELALYLPSIIK